MTIQWIGLGETGATVDLVRQADPLDWHSGALDGRPYPVGSARLPQPS